MFNFFKKKEPIIFKGKDLSVWYYLGYTRISFHEKDNEDDVIAKEKVYFFCKQDDIDIRSFVLGSGEKYNSFTGHSYVKETCEEWAGNILHITTGIECPSEDLKELMLKAADGPYVWFDNRWCTKSEASKKIIKDPDEKDIANNNVIKVKFSENTSSKGD